MNVEVLIVLLGTTGIFRRSMDVVAGELLGVLIRHWVDSEFVGGKMGRNFSSGKRDDCAK
jgi:hypothetical protein